MVTTNDGKPVITKKFFCIVGTLESQLKTQRVDHDSEDDEIEHDQLNLINIANQFVTMNAKSANYFGH